MDEIEISEKDFILGLNLGALLIVIAMSGINTLSRLLKEEELYPLISYVLLPYGLVLFCCITLSGDTFRRSIGKVAAATACMSLISGAVMIGLEIENPDPMGVMMKTLTLCVLPSYLARIPKTNQLSTEAVV